MLQLPDINHFDYHLPEEKIARFPLPQRDASRLLHYRDGRITDSHFYHIIDLLPDDARLFFNETKVVMARLLFALPSGKIIEVFCLEPMPGMSVEQIMQQKRQVQYICLVGGAKKWKNEHPIDIQLQLNDQMITLSLEKKQNLEGKFVIDFQWDANVTFAEVLDAAGKVPLPPYIKREVEKSDKDRYQTVFARRRGSVAAPTAGLHFTDELLHKIDQKGIKRYFLNLHVGGGTFLPVKDTDLRQHSMHREEMFLEAVHLRKMAEKGGARIAVGTTSLRYMESLYWLGVKALENKDFSRLDQWEAWELPGNYTLEESLNALAKAVEGAGGQLYASTQLLIFPSYQFKIADVLITNFHQPRSTLLLLVAAFVGPDWKKIYEHALAENYRFLSYGDSNLLWRKRSE